MARTPRRFGTGQVQNHQLPDSADDLPEVVSVDLDAKDPNAFEVVEVDDTPEADRGKPTEITESLADQEENLRGRGTKKSFDARINRMKFEIETERRGKEQIQRERDTAIEFARKQETELAELRRRVDGGTQALSVSMQAEKDAKIADAQRRLTQAHTDGDSAAIVAATTDLGQAQAEKLAVISRTPRALTDAERAEADKARAAAIPQAQPQRAELKPNVAKWIASNDAWFNKDKEKTQMAYAIHDRILKRGIADDSPEYTRELDKGLKAVYPDHQSSSSDEGENGGQRRSSTPRRTDVTAEGSRATERQQPSNSRIVELTRSELSIAKTLNLTPQQYAASKLKHMAAGVAHDD